MKKTVYLVLVPAAILFAASSARPQAAPEATIEPEAKAQLILKTHLSSKLNEVGDTFTATLDEPIFADGQLVMQRGTEFHGRVTAVSPAGARAEGRQHDCCV